MEAFKIAYDIQTNDKLSVDAFNKWSIAAGLEMRLNLNASTPLSAMEIHEQIQAINDEQEAEIILQELAKFVSDGISSIFHRYRKFGQRSGENFISKFQIERLLLDANLVTRNINSDGVEMTRAEFQVLYAEIFGRNYKLDLTEFSQLLKTISAEKNTALVEILKIILEVHPE